VFFFFFKVEEENCLKPAISVFYEQIIYVMIGIIHRTRTRIAERQELTQRSSIEILLIPSFHDTSSYYG